MPGHCSNCEPGDDVLTTVEPCIQLREVRKRTFRVPLASHHVVAHALDTDEMEEKVSISPRCYGSVIGRKGTTKRTLERRFNCKIIVPSANPKDRGPYLPIRIIGCSPEHVRNATEEIRSTAAKFRESQSYTHELVVPILCNTSGTVSGRADAPSLATAIIVAKIRLLDAYELVIAQQCMRALKSELRALCIQLGLSAEGSVAGICTFDPKSDTASLDNKSLSIFTSIVDSLRRGGLDIESHWIHSPPSSTSGADQLFKFDAIDQAWEAYGDCTGRPDAPFSFDKFVIRSIKHKQTVLVQISL